MPSNRCPDGPAKWHMQLAALNLVGSTSGFHRFRSKTNECFAERLTKFEACAAAMLAYDVGL